MSELPMTTLDRNDQGLWTLAADLGVSLAPLRRKSSQPDINALGTDTHAAQEALEALRLQRFNSKRHVLRRNPSKDPWKPQELDTVLEDMVAKDCSVEQLKGVVDQGALVYRPAAEKRGIRESISRKKPTDNRSSALSLAAQKRRADLLAVLAPHADSICINQAFAVAVSTEDVASIDTLLAYRANPNIHGAVFQEFVARKQTTLVSSMTNGKVPIQAELATRALSAAVSNNDVTSSRALIQAGADSNCDSGLTFLSAIKKPDMEIAIHMCLSTVPPSPETLSMVAKVINLGSSLEQHHFQRAVMLLSAGLPESSIHETLITAVKSANVQLVSLLVRKYDASLSYSDCQAGKLCIKNENPQLLKVLLEAQDASTASNKLLPFLQTLNDDLQTAIYQEILTALLSCAPSSKTLAMCLLHASKSNKIHEVTKLVEHGASADFNNGDALEFAVSKVRVDMVGVLCHAVHQTKTRLRVLPVLMTAERESRLAMAQLVLNSNVKGDEVDDALAQLANESDPLDYSLIKILVSKANVNVQNGEFFRAASAKGDQNMLQILLTGNFDSVSIGCAVVATLSLQDSSKVISQLSILAPHKADQSSLEEALLRAVDRIDESFEPLHILLRQANGNVDFKDGELLVKALKHCNLYLMTLLLEHSGVQHTWERLLQILPSVSDVDFGLKTCEIVLRKGPSQSSRNSALMLALSQIEINKPLLDLLLSSNADVNHDSGFSITIAIEKKDLQLFKRLLTSKVLSESTQDSVLASVLAMEAEQTKLEWLTAFLVSNRNKNLTILTKYLHLSFGDRNTDNSLLRILLANEAKVDVRSIAKACESLNIAALEMLLERTEVPAHFLAALESCLRVPISERHPVLSLVLRKVDEAKIAQSPDIVRYKAHQLIHYIKNEQTSVEVIEILKLFLKHSANIDLQNYQCLHDSVTMCKYDELKEMLEYLEDNTVLNKLFGTAIDAELIWSSENGPKILTLLIDTGASGSVLDEALLIGADYYSTRSQSRNIVKLVIRNGARPDNLGSRVLHSAAEQGSATLFEDILEGECSLTALENTLGQLLSQTHEDTEMMRILELMETRTKGGLNLNTPQDGLFPCLFQSFLQGYSCKIFEKLLAMGASPEQTSLIELIENKGPEKVPILTYLLSNPLGLSSPQEIIGMLNSLLSRSADVNQRSSKSRLTPILLATYKGYNSLIKPLLNKSANVNVTWKGKTPLFYTSSKGAVPALKLILAAGADADDGSLHEAACNWDWAVVEILLEAGHKVNHTSSLHNEQTALQAVVTAPHPPGKEQQDLKKTIGALYLSGPSNLPTRGGKSLIFIALDSPIPVAMIKALLNVCGPAFAGEEYRADGQVFSVLGYIHRNKDRWDESLVAHLVLILENSGVEDVRYNLVGPQPGDYAGAPEHIREREIEYQNREQRRAEERREREERAAAEQQEYEERLAKQKAEAMLQQQLSQQAHKLSMAQESEQARARDSAARAAAQRAIDIDRQKAVEDERIAEHRRQAELHYNQSLSRIRLEEQRESDKQRRAIMSEQDSYAQREHSRQMGTIQAKGLLMQEQARLMQSMASIQTPSTHRQIGYVEDLG